MLDFMQDSHLLMAPPLKSPPSNTGKSPTRSLFTRAVENVYVFISNALFTLEKLNFLAAEVESLNFSADFSVRKPTDIV